MGRPRIYPLPKVDDVFNGRRVTKLLGRDPVRADLRVEIVCERCGKTTESVAHNLRDTKCRCMTPFTPRLPEAVRAQFSPAPRAFPLGRFIAERRNRGEL